MRVVLVTGGARSGKSRHALELARDAGGDYVTVIATARVSDPEMERRVRAHRRERPDGWTTLEAPLAADDALRRAPADVVVLDCLTLLISNALEEAPPSDVGEAVDAGRRITARLLEAAAGRDGTLLVVTNEVGMGVVPASPLGRWFRDAQGRANQALAEAAERVVLMVSGQPLEVKSTGRR